MLKNFHYVTSKEEASVKNTCCHAFLFSFAAPLTYRIGYQSGVAFYLSINILFAKKCFQYNELIFSQFNIWMELNTAKMLTASISYCAIHI